MSIKLNELFKIDLEQNGEVVEQVSGTITPILRSLKKEAKATGKAANKELSEIKQKTEDNKRLYTQIEKVKDTATDEELIEMYDKYDIAELEIVEQNEAFAENYDLEDYYIKEFTETIGGEQKARLEQLCEQYGYKTILDEIKRVVTEGKSSDMKSSLDGAGNSQVEQATPQIPETQSSPTQTQAQ